jgi:hypothetical protein
MVAPDPGVAPVIPPVTVPIVHANILGAVAVKPILVAVPLQIAAVLLEFTAGIGFTVTVIVYGVPGHAGVAVDVGVTIYCTVPEVALLGLVKVWEIVFPVPILAPVILPVTAPTVQLKVLAVLDVKPILVAVPLQIAAVFNVVTTGTGFTVTVIV